MITRGLSPRMRGNPRAKPLPRRRRGSIPAYAGEPSSIRTTTAHTEVYPRVCGGTGFQATAAAWCAGLSPRMRGNRRRQPPPPPLRGSIPAYAGEPAEYSRGTGPTGVYPRVCGGTAHHRSIASAVSGLSPRMRGNHADRHRHDNQTGSIPAYAGEPPEPFLPYLAQRVYPRVCGGTSPCRAWLPPIRGLSPRMRGNRAVDGAGQPTDRSIPAYAGEPHRQPARCGLATVYPRVCGGTAPVTCGAAADRGLSPRMRGNRCSWCWPIRDERSIPAYAGEPLSETPALSAGTVYPRVCGGTGACECGDVSPLGLSPRMRGNLTQYFAHHIAVGSIPAYAGEPYLC